MAKYRDHREPRRRRNEDDANYLSERTSEPSYFQHPAPVRAQPVDAEVVWFNESKGFGFVKLQDGADAYLHIRTLEAAGRNSVLEGTQIKVTVEENQRGRQVAQVLEVGETVTRRPSPVWSTEAVSRGPKPAGEISGTVKWYNSEKGFGFIAPGDGDKDVFVHATTLGRSGLTALAEGQEVLMECRQGKRGLEVHRLRLV